MEKKRKQVLLPIIWVVIILAVVASIVGQSAISMLNAVEKYEQATEKDDLIFLEDTIMGQTTLTLQGIKDGWTHYSKYEEGTLHDYLCLVSRTVYLFDSDIQGFMVIDRDTEEIMFNSFANGVKYPNLVDNDIIQNKEAFTQSQTQMLRSNDWLGNTYFVGASFEPKLTLEQAKDFKNYPLGDYNRLFLQKIVLPYPSHDREGSVLVFAYVSEQSIYSPYSEVYIMQAKANKDAKKHVDRILFLVWFVIIPILAFTGIYVSFRIKELLRELMRYE